MNLENFPGIPVVPGTFLNYLRFLPKKFKHPAISLKFTLVRPCSRPRYTSQPCFLVFPIFVPLVLTPWFLVPGAWPRRVSLEEPERRWREKRGRTGAERQTPKPQLQQPCLALPSLPFFCSPFTSLSKKLAWHTPQLCH